ncbi:MAG TPA: hypothetical protein VMR80_08850 [Candidatus Acidoferrum sp.]|jgi:hypothetical protein|nr:hypothetical protein [Candidatus Acidoferrum sp.]
MTDSYLFDVGWMFFTALTVGVIVVLVAAFGRDLFPFLFHSEIARGSRPQKLQRLENSK